MKKFLIFLTTLFALLGIGFAIDISQIGEISVPDNALTDTYVKGELIIKYSDSKYSTQDIVKKTDTNNFDLIDASQSAGLALIKVDPNENIDNLIENFENNPEIEYAQPNYIYQLDFQDPNDTRFNQLWGLKNSGQIIYDQAGTSGVDTQWTDAMDIHNQGNSGTGAIVAIIDDGIYRSHPDLTSNLWDGTNCVDENNNYLGNCVYGYDFEHGDRDPYPDGTSTHGTHIAGTIAATMNNNYGIVGLNPNAKIMGLKVGGTTLERVKAINFAKYNGASVINASWSCYNKDHGGTHMVCFSGYDYQDIALKTAIEQFPGLFIASAGNGNGDPDPDGENIDQADSTNDNDLLRPFPCALDSSNIICVAATDYNDSLTSFSNFGNISVDVGAPGYDILSTIKSLSGYVYEFNDNNESYAIGALPDWVDTYIGNWGVIDTGIVGRGKVLIADTNYSPYSSGSNTYVVSRTYNLSGEKDVTLEGNVACDTEYDLGSNDYFTVDFWNGTNFETVITGNELILDTDTNPSGLAAMSFKLYLQDKNNLPDFRFRISWHTDSADNNYIGCFFDSVKLKKSTYNSMFSYYNGTSMAVPHVVGLVSLLWNYNQNLTREQVKSAILDYGETIPALVGKTTTGKRINAYQTLAHFTNPSVSNLTGNIVNGYTNANPNFSWTSPVNQGIMSGYRIYFTGLNNFLYSGFVTQPSFSGYSFLYGNYTMKVVGENSVGNTGDAKYLSFNVDTIAPYSPTLTSPSNGSALNGNINLLWNSTQDLGSGLSGYIYEISVNQSMSPLYQTGLVFTTGVTLNLPSNTYYWRVKAFDKVNNMSTYSSIYNFNKSGPTVSNIYHEFSGADSVKIKFQTDMIGTGYVMYGTDQNSLNLVSTGINDISHTITINGLPSNTTYFYKVYAMSNGRSGAISSIKTFTTPQIINSSFSNAILNITGSALLSGNFSTNTGSVTFSSTGTLNILNATGSNKLVIPTNGLKILWSGGNWDGNIMAPEITYVSGTITTPGTYVASNYYEIGSPDVELIFSGQNIQVTLQVDSSYNGKILQVYRSTDGGNTFNYITTCLVNAGLCTFETNQLSSVVLGRVPDNTPDPFDFQNKTDLELASSSLTNTVTVSGINTGTNITTTSGILVINNMNSGTSSLVNNGDQVQVRLTASSIYSTTLGATVTIGTLSDSFSYTTKTGDSSSGGGSGGGGGGGGGGGTIVSRVIVNNISIRKDLDTINTQSDKLLNELKTKFQNPTINKLFSQFSDIVTKDIEEISVLRKIIDDQEMFDKYIDGIKKLNTALGNFASGKIDLKEFKNQVNQYLNIKKTYEESKDSIFDITKRKINGTEIEIKVLKKSLVNTDVINTLTQLILNKIGKSKIDSQSVSKSINYYNNGLYYLNLYKITKEQKYRDSAKENLFNMVKLIIK